MTRRNAAEARALVEASLAASAGDDGIDRAIIGDPVPAGDYWVFFYQGRAYLDDDDLDAMLVGNGPIVVPPEGELFALSVTGDIDAQISELTDRSR